MKSDKPQKIKTRSKLQLIAIPCLIMFLSLGILRFFLGWYHTRAIFTTQQVMAINYLIGIFLAIYIGMVIYYRIRKNRWL